MAALFSQQDQGIYGWSIRGCSTSAVNGAVAEVAAADVQMLCGDREDVRGAGKDVVPPDIARLAGEAAFARDGAVEDRERLDAAGGDGTHGMMEV